jgi:hypothetical protein
VFIPYLFLAVFLFYLFSGFFIRFCFYKKNENKCGGDQFRPFPTAVNPAEFVVPSRQAHHRAPPPSISPPPPNLQQSAAAAAGRIHLVATLSDLQLPPLTYPPVRPPSSDSSPTHGMQPLCCAYI